MMTKDQRAEAPERTKKSGISLRLGTSILWAKVHGTSRHNLHAPLRGRNMDELKGRMAKGYGSYSGEGNEGS
jgi:hypothetical protein